MDYYLYTHSNSEGIFYVGKGCNYRVRQKYLSNRCKDWHNLADKGYLSKIVATGSEKSILSLEKMYIKLLVNEGIKLVNKAHNPNYKKTLSAEHRRKMSEARKGKKHSDETKAKISKVHKGKPKSTEHRKKIGDIRRGKVPWNKGLSQATLQTDSL
jgi:hypothetical protein